MVRGESRLLVPFPDGGDVGRGVGRDMLGVGACGLGRSLEHVEVCVWHAGERLGLKQMRASST